MSTSRAFLQAAPVDPVVDDVVIDIVSASKRFKLYDNFVTGPLKELLFFWRRERYYRPHLAVDELSLQVRRGEVVGLIGANGAGKTTLLKMIAGMLPVDAGSVTVRGKVTALLAMGVGVHPEFTGRENILFSGLLLGMSRLEIARREESIVEFAELGEYIDRPFRTYSSGMKARLLFSISMSVDPDVLIVDEALATGDAYFVEKCAARIRELCASGATILFVSHNLAQVESLCQRALLLEEGHLVADGPPAGVIATYQERLFERESRAPFVVDAGDLPLAGGTGEVAVTAVTLRDEHGRVTTGFRTGGRMQVELEYRSNLRPGHSGNLFVGFLRWEDRAYVGEFNSVGHLVPGHSGVQRSSVTLDRQGVVRVDLGPLVLLNNHYALWLMLYDGPRVFCEYKAVRPFFVARPNEAVMRDALFWQPGVVRD